MLVLVTTHLCRKKRLACLISGGTTLRLAAFSCYGSAGSEGIGNGEIDGTGNGAFEISESMSPVT